MNLQEVSTLTAAGGTCLPGFEALGCTDSTGKLIGQDVIWGYIDQVHSLYDDFSLVHLTLHCRWQRHPTRMLAAMSRQKPGSMQIIIFSIRADAAAAPATWPLGKYVHGRP